VGSKGSSSSFRGISTCSPIKATVVELVDPAVAIAARIESGREENNTASPHQEEVQVW